MGSDAGRAAFDVSKVCLASVLPDNMDRDLYCSRGGNCPHKMGWGYKRLLKEMLPHPSELITVKETKVKTEPAEAAKEQPAKKAKTKGAKGGRGAGRGGRGTQKKE